ncbi:uncharacterized protein PV09_05729 [Verruconis gallopava]|uniref:F-box domain-containing protein n=1 Tax=Verruconis gallopava TaxID=253628 RepID=A0A0D2AVC7_9PEZI|nr:uncharacterized protein PV09_05729 [Verruconis gallopava]KIW03084.1 hypothetical protein PV09_05729 [Verruconis gallopava]
MSPNRTAWLDNSASPLLRLPPELRTHLWSLLLVRPRTKFRYATSQFSPEKRNTYFRTLLSIMLLCHQIRDEAMTIFLKHNHIVLYRLCKPQLPQRLRLDDHWFTMSPAPIRYLSLKGHDIFETPKLIASCSELRFLSISWLALSACYDAAAERCKDAWILQYQTNLARLLGRHDGRIRIQENETDCEAFELLGCGKPVDTDEVIALIDESREKCRAVVHFSQQKAKVEGGEEALGSWIVRVSFTTGGVVTVRLIRRTDDSGV